MKQLRFLILILILGMGASVSNAQEDVLIKQFSGERSKAGEAVIKNSKKYPKDGMGCTEFEISVPKAGNYYVNFWMIPTQETTGKPSNYTVEVNGKAIKDKVMPIKCDWHSVALPHSVYLSEGTNTIALLGELPFLPEVETLKLSSNQGGATISSELYDTYKQSIISGTIRQQSQDNLSLSGNRLSCPSFGVSWLGQQINYTFTTTLYLNQGTLYNFKSTSNGAYQHYLELDTHPVANCQRILSTNGQASASPSTYGLYTIRVRSSQHGVTGTINFSVNGVTQYSNVPICNYERAYSQPTDKEYNSFLCYKTGSGDPYMDLMSYSSNRIYLARNDNGSSYGGDHNWGVCSRIKIQLSVPTDAALVFNNSSSYPTCTADVYLGFPNLSDVDNSTFSYFPNLKSGDAIASAPASTVYRCAAWAVGIWDHHRWPPQESIIDHPEFANCTTELERFDVYFGMFGYTRNGATEANSIIDLWKNGNYYQHVSVRKNNNYDNIPHGYAWESKLGALPRVFHPRYALTGSSYGVVTDYYKKNPSSMMTSSLFENVADGRMVIENVVFNKEEISLINKIICKISTEKANELSSLYQKWTEAASLSPYSSISSMKDCEEYRSLYKYCEKNKELQYFLFKMLGEDEEMVLYLIQDLLYQQHPQLLEKLKEDNLNNMKIGDVTVYRKPIASVKKFVKMLLASTDSSNHTNRKIAAKDLSYSNKDAFNLNISDNTLIVNFLLNEDAKVSLLVYTLDGTIAASVLNDKRLSAGNYSYNITMEKSGTYLVVYKENGTTSVKKVIVH